MDTYSHIACLCTGHEGYGIGHVLKTMALNFPGLLFIYQDNGPLSKWLCEHQMRTHRLESLVYWGLKPGQSTINGVLKFSTLYFRMRKAAEDMNALLEAEKVSIVHTHGLANQLTAGFLPKGRYRKIWHSHKVINEKRLFGLNKLTHSFAVGRCATDLICVSQYAMRQFTVKKVRRHVLYNGIEIVHPTLPHREFKPPFHLIAAGRMIRYKGFHLCLTALAAIRAKGLEARLHIFGGPLNEKGYYGELKAMAEKLGIASEVTFYGYVDDIRQRTTAMHLALHLHTEIEPCGIWVQEAMLDGLPVVATRCGGPEELIDDGQNGFLVEKEDVARQAQAIVTLLSDETLYRKMSQAAYQKALENFTTETFIRKIQNVYDL